MTTRSAPRPRFAAAALAVLCSAWPCIAAADGPDPAAADQLFRQAQSEVEQGHFDTACPKFAESQRLDPAAGTLLNLADCEEHIGQLANAWQHWHEGLDRLPSNDDRIAFAKQRIAALDRRVPRLTLRLPPGAPAETRVKRDGIELGRPSLGTALPVNPGQHLIVVTAPGRAPAQQAVDVAEGARQEVTVSLGTPESGAANATADRAAPGETSSGSGKRTAGFVLAGVGVVGLAVAGVTGAMILGDKSKVNDQCPSGACNADGYDAWNAGKKLLVPNAIAWGIGVVALGVGVVLIATGGPTKRATTSLRAGASRDRASLAVSTAF